jgi:hypothetical protein
VWECFLCKNNCCFRTSHRAACDTQTGSCRLRGRGEVSYQSWAAVCAALNLMSQFGLLEGSHCTDLKSRGRFSKNRRLIRCCEIVCTLVQPIWSEISYTSTSNAPCHHVSVTLDDRNTVSRIRGTRCRTSWKGRRVHSFPRRIRAIASE